LNDIGAVAQINSKAMTPGDPMLQKAVDNVFKMGRARNNFGRVVPVNQDVDKMLGDIKRLTGAGIGTVRVEVTDQTAVKNMLSRIPVGEPFSDMEGLIKSPADVIHFNAVRGLVIDLLRGQATATRLGNLPGALKTAAGDIARAAGVEQ
jgi:hypothetical protein